MNRRVQGSLAAALGLLLGGCASQPTPSTPIAALPANAATAPAPPTAGEQEKGAHETAHGGVLNAIVKCEIGHAEVKREGDILSVWFVGGAPDTTRAVPIPDKTVTLQITTSGNAAPRTLTLTPKPLDLAGETVGHCSRFEGKADWLARLDTFTATAQVTFKGAKQPLRIEYPKGYDPD
ncbi:MAG TPA: hypothetical protein VKU00_18710 [Chthonomonadaceae bacterium]|nr:hypothetical protein [Chthonomonadaceae bacterium]